MSLEDEIIARRAANNAKSLADADLAARDAAGLIAAKGELRALISEALKILRANSAKRAIDVEHRFGTKGWSQKPWFDVSAQPSGYPLGSPSGGLFVLDDDELLRHAKVFSVIVPDQYRAESNRLVENLRREHNGARLLCVGSPIGSELKKPSGWESTFFVESGQLLYGYCEGRPEPARKIFTERVAEALDA
ncbi:MAG: hypothetical protein JWN09_1545 [Microbacteriaceae bacterium]|nr:hypothetical protein [Microbacteriaceae bacterium]